VHRGGPPSTGASRGSIPPRNPAIRGHPFVGLPGLGGNWGRPVAPTTPSALTLLLVTLFHPRAQLWPNPDRPTGWWRRIIPRRGGRRKKKQNAHLGTWASPPCPRPSSQNTPFPHVYCVGERESDEELRDTGWTLNQELEGNFSRVLTALE